MPVNGDNGCGDPLHAPPGGVSLTPGWMAVGGGGAGVLSGCACAVVGGSGVPVGSGVAVGCGVLVGCGVGVAVGAGVSVGSSVAVGCGVPVGVVVFVSVGAGVLVGAGVSVGTGVSVGSGTGVSVGNGVLGGAGVAVGCGVSVGAGVSVGTGVRVAAAVWRGMFTPRVTDALPPLDSIVIVLRKLPVAASSLIRSVISPSPVTGSSGLTSSAQSGTDVTRHSSVSLPTFVTENVARACSAEWSNIVPNCTSVGLTSSNGPSSTLKVTASWSV